MIFLINRNSIDYVFKQLENLLAQEISNIKNKSELNENQNDKEKIKKYMQQKQIQGEESEYDSVLKEFNFNFLEALKSDLDEFTKLAYFINTISAYLVNFKKKGYENVLKNLTIKLYDSVNLWLSKLFR